MAETWLKDPDATLNYKFDWAPLENGTGSSNWLDRTSSPVESISTADIAIDSPGPTVDASAITDNNTTVTVKLSGGVVGQTYYCRCRITTSEGQIDDRTAIVKMVQR